MRKLTDEEAWLELKTAMEATGCIPGGTIVTFTYAGDRKEYPVKNAGMCGALSDMVDEGLISLRTRYKMLDQLQRIFPQANYSLISRAYRGDKKRIDAVNKILGNIRAKRLNNGK